MPRRLAVNPDTIAEAAALLKDGAIVAFPTETVYGLGADTFNEAALRRVFALKGRPEDNPLIAHVRDADEARLVVVEWIAQADALATQFWPGPLSLILSRHANVPALATGGRDTIAVRSPSHPVARALLNAFDGPISAPSANRSGHVSPTLAEHVLNDFPGADDLLVLDGGPSEFGIESTVLDLTQSPPVILRPGSVSAEAIAAALGEPVTVGKPVRQSSSPGTSPAHYAPRTPLDLVARDELLERLSSSREPMVVLAIGWLDVPPPHRLIMMPGDADLYAAMLYDSLRKADTTKSRRILVERPTAPGDMWDALRNRLGRAASST